MLHQSYLSLVYKSQSYQCPYPPCPNIPTQDLHRRVKVHLFVIWPLRALSWCDWPLTQKVPVASGHRGYRPSFCYSGGREGKSFPGQGSWRCHMLGRLSHGLPLSNDSGGFEGRAQFPFTAHPSWEDATHLGYQFSLMRSASMEDDRN